MAAAAPQVVDVVTAYNARVSAARKRAVDTLTLAWGSLDNYRSADIERFVRQVVPVVEGAQLQVATLTDGYLAQLEAQVLGATVRPLGVPRRVVSNAAMRGVSTADVYRRAGPTVWTSLSRGQSLEAAARAGLSRMQRTAETDIQLARTHSSRYILSRKSNVVGHRRVLRGAGSCILCAVASTQRYRKSELQPIHPGCVAEGTIVSGSFARKGTRRWHEGEGIVLHVASGHLLTITPNHPVLTPRGWVPAGMLREGDDVVGCPDAQRVVDGVPHEHQPPARVEDRFGALAVRALVRVPLAAEDFHGDVADGEIHVVAEHGFLWDRVQSTLVQPTGQQFLAERVEGAESLPGGSILEALIVAVDAAAGSHVGSGRLRHALVSAHALCAVHAGGAAATDLDACIDQVSTDHLAAHIEGGGQGQLGLTCEIAGDDSVRQLDAFGAGTLRKFDAPRSQLTADDRLTYARQGRRLLDRLAGSVQIDRVVELRRVHTSGHVYNLQTDEGWYSANSVVVSNCDCGVEPIYGSEDPGQVIDPERLASVQQSLQDRFGHSDVRRSASTGRRATSETSFDDARKLVVTHEHGEIGPVLAIKGQRFTSAEDLDIGR